MPKKPKPPPRFTREEAGIISCLLVLAELLPGWPCPKQQKARIREKYRTDKAWRREVDRLGREVVEQLLGGVT